MIIIFTCVTLFLQISDASLWKDGRLSYIRPHESSALEIAAEQMRLWPNIDPSKFLTVAFQANFFCDKLRQYLRGVEFIPSMIVKNK